MMHLYKNINIDLKKNLASFGWIDPDNIFLVLTLALRSTSFILHSKINFPANQ